MNIIKSAILAGALAAGIAAPAAAQERVKLGMLDCGVEGGFNFAIITRSNLDCTFTPTHPGLLAESYSGSIEKFGLDIGKTQNTLIRWAVIAPTIDGLSDGALAGTYGGASAQATLVIGLGANVLVGGWESSIALQPVSVQSQEGLNVAVGIAQLRLNAN